ncbi:flagellar basal body rod protein FlgB [Gudongella oleilytica]|jgi:flagellar basal-body rod protein FlgB|uniref:flagellar basal body rod protein FlgB n=1 Tax=Gudongella oleilytica TaxID=1582259 RepID=UPI002A370215|nr:flagellar basal body rod protein FlgB [Gudongella oleilytica]MDY0256551.1 flagellar basal body rod protein FlgB [Gudongella oleilytica]HMM68968.1 flagellar basal body rod protein FlgB [Gudongella oleilytica]
MPDYSYSMIKNALDASSMRQRAISSNIANINTPNYKVNKVEFEEHLKNAINGTSLKKTHEKHFGANGIGDVKATIEKKKNTSLDETGNNVDIDIEMTELAANEIYYSTLIQLLNAKYSKLNAAINR